MTPTAEQDPQKQLVLLSPAAALQLTPGHCTSLRLNYIFVTDFMFFLLRNVFTVKAKEKATFVYHMKKPVLLWNSAKPQTKKKRKTDLP